MEVTLRLLLVDDDPGLRALLRATLDAVDVEVDDAEDVPTALAAIGQQRPDAIVLDVNLPGMDGLAFCRQLKNERETNEIPIVVLSGSDGGTAEAALEAGAESFLRKPFSPLELLAVVERLAGGLYGVPFRATKKREPEEQLLLYARDLRHLLEIERGQRHLLENAYHETVTALATALETKDTGTRAHSQRVQRYALELTKAIDPELIDDQSTEYGFLLHDVGKIGIPDGILLKPGPLTDAERRRMQTHTILGEQMLGGVAFFQGEGLRVVRSHHERWDGAGYPDGIAGTEIPLAARIFAVADALDAMTSDRPYRKAMSWAAAGREILAESKRQFDPEVVESFVARERSLRAIRREFAAAA
ncbi:MAG: response regulator [Actinobacteria bacterium]|nr:MAG: response regulator [Actinomycetota bacterium]